ncbi:MAG: LuxR C-terminal-related transcriptional regulator [Bacteroidia bacterium]
MAKKTSNSPTTLPVYEEYHTFLQEMGLSKHFKDYKYYLKQYSFFKNMVDVLPGAVYILNFETDQYLFASQSSVSILGYTANEMLQMGREFIVNQIHSDDRKIYGGAPFKRFIEFIKQIPADELKKCRFSVNYRFKRKDGVHIKLLQQYVVLEVNDAGFPLLCLGLVTDITAHKSDNKMIFSISKYDKKKGFEAISTDTFPQQAVCISKRECDIVKYMLQGLTSQAIADKLFVSLHTVSTHRKNILKKTNCKNTAELSRYAILNGLG